jgi:hypothetical protein
MQPPNDEYAWFRQQFSDEALEQYRRERFNTQALAEIGEKLAIETDAAFIDDWMRWARERQPKTERMYAEIPHDDLVRILHDVEPTRPYYWRVNDPEMDSLDTFYANYKQDVLDSLTDDERAFYERKYRRGSE